jgi:hypothetical protein
VYWGFHDSIIAWTGSTIFTRKYLANRYTFSRAVRVNRYRDRLKTRRMPCCLRKMSEMPFKRER